MNTRKLLFATLILVFNPLLFSAQAVQQQKPNSAESQREKNERLRAELEALKKQREDAEVRIKVIKEENLLHDQKVGLLSEAEEFVHKFVNIKFIRCDGSTYARAEVDTGLSSNRLYCIFELDGEVTGRLKGEAGPDMWRGTLEIIEPAKMVQCWQKYGYGQYERIKKLPVVVSPRDPFKAFISITGSKGNFSARVITGRGGPNATLLDSPSSCQAIFDELK